VNGSNIVYQQFIALYNSGCQIFCNYMYNPNSSRGLSISTPKYHATDKTDTGPTKSCSWP